MQVMKRESNTNPNPNLLIAVLCFGGLLASFMQTLVVPIVGKLPGYLDTSSDNASWVITATLLGELESKIAVAKPCQVVHGAPVR